MEAKTVETIAQNVRTLSKKAMTVNRALREDSETVNFFEDLGNVPADIRDRINETTKYGINCGEVEYDQRLTLYREAKTVWHTSGCMERAGLSLMLSMFADRIDRDLE